MKIINEFYQKAEDMKTREPLVEGGAEWLTDIIGNDKEHSVWVVASEAPFSSDCPFTLLFKKNENDLLEVVGYDADESLWIFDPSGEDVYPDYVMIKWLSPKDISFDEADRKTKQYKGCCFEDAYKLLSEFMEKYEDECCYNIQQLPDESVTNFMYRVMVIIGELKTECFTCDAICACSNCGHPVLNMDDIYYPKQESYSETLDMYLLGYK